MKNRKANNIRFNINSDIKLNRELLMPHNIVIPPIPKIPNHIYDSKLYSDKNKVKAANISSSDFTDDVLDKDKNFINLLVTRKCVIDIYILVRKLMEKTLENSSNVMVIGNEDIYDFITKDSKYIFSNSDIRIHEKNGNFIYCILDIEKLPLQMDFSEIGLIISDNVNMSSNKLKRLNKIYQATTINIIDLPSHMSSAEIYYWFDIVVVYENLKITNQKFYFVDLQQSNINPEIVKISSLKGNPK